MTLEQRVALAVAAVVSSHRTFGGDKPASGNPIAAALEGEPPVFALGVDVCDVVCTVLTASMPELFSVPPTGWIAPWTFERESPMDEAGYDEGDCRRPWEAWERLRTFWLSGYGTETEEGK